MKSDEPEEDKRERFKTIAMKRVNKTLKDIRLVGNLSNMVNYTYTDEEANKICSVLEAEIALLRPRFDRTNISEKDGFEL